MCAVSVYFGKQNLKKKRELDSQATQALIDGLKAYQRERPPEIAASKYGVRTYEKLRLGEVTRHFDNNTSAAIHGWMTHDLGMHGWGVRVGSVGIGKIGLSGASEVSLTSSGTNRDDLMGDGFVAVLERETDKGLDTLRVVVPSENAAKEWLGAWLKESLRRFESTTNKGQVVTYPQCHSALQGRISEILAFKNEASYVSDRLHSVLRMPPESRPLITVYGPSLSDHAIVGSAIRFGDDDRLLPLFPVALVKTLPQTVEQAVAILHQRQATLPAPK